MADDEKKFLKRCLELAQKGAGSVSPNPKVGAVVTLNGEIIAEGYHRYFGGPHAEVEALKCLPPEVSPDAVLYLNLEPCCHFGKTPPCTNLILNKKIKKVVVGMLDPNPQVNGKGIEFLRHNGLDVKVGVLESHCRELNYGYIKRIQTGLPSVLLKTAITLDGRIATSLKDSRWITGKPARIYSHQLRAQVDAVLVGVGTVLADNPLLTVRHVQGRNPLRVILDTHLQTPLNSNILHHQDKAPTLILTGENTTADKISAFLATGIKVARIAADADGRISLKEALKYLGAEGITSVMVEGGATIFTNFIKQDLVDKLLVAMAPELIGSDGIPVVGQLGINNMTQVKRWKFRRVKRLGEDILLEICLHNY